MKLAILSDTHDLLRPEVLEQLHTADAILHAGDISSQAVVDQDGVHRAAVHCAGQQRQGVGPGHSHDLTVTLGGVTFYMVHQKKEVPPDLPGVDAVVFGHSHRYTQEEKDNILWLNPGSCGPRRFHQEITMMMAEAADGSIQVEKILIPHSQT